MYEILIKIWILCYTINHSSFSHGCLQQHSIFLWALLYSADFAGNSRKNYCDWLCRLVGQYGQ